MLSHLPGYSLPERLWRTARRWALAWGRIVYLGAVMLVLVLSPSSYTRAARRRAHQPHGAARPATDR